MSLRTLDIVVPKPVDGYATAHVLTMDYVDGVKITALSPLMRIDIDAQELAGTLVHAYLKQIVLDGVFHADRDDPLHDRAAAAGLWLGYDIVGADRAHGRRS